MKKLIIILFSLLYIGDAKGVSITIAYNNAGWSPVSSGNACSGTDLFVDVCNGCVSYQWKKDGANISGATATTYSVTTTGTYSCVATDAVGATASSNSLYLNIVASPTAPTFINEVNGRLDDCFNAVSMDWNSAFIGGTYSFISWSGSWGYPLSPNIGLMNVESGLYYVTLTTNCGTADKFFIVRNTGSGGSYIANRVASVSGKYNICGQDSIQLCVLNKTGSNLPSSDNEMEWDSYTWTRNGTTIATGSSWTAKRIFASQPGYYKCYISNTCNGGQPYPTDSLLITASAIPTVSISASGSTTACSGNSVFLIANPSTGLGYQWKKDGINITYATNNTYSATSIGSYTVEASTSSGCTAISNPINVTIIYTPAIITPVGTTSPCGSGASVVLNAYVVPGYTYQWKLGGINIAGATGTSYTATASGSYTVVVTSSCTSTTSTAVNVNINPVATATITPVGSTTICQGGSVNLNANTGTGFTYQWKLGGVNISGATAASYSATTAGSYTVVVNNSCSTATSAAVIVSVNPAITATITAGGPTTICPGGSVILNAGSGTGYTYQWLKNSTPIANATSQSYSASSSGSYNIVVSYSGSCSKISSPVVVSFSSGQINTFTLKPNGANGIDAHVSSYSTLVNSNFGNLTGLLPLAWTAGGSPVTSRGLLKFDVSAIPTNAIIDQATITLYNDPLSSSGSPLGQHSSLSGPNTALLRKTTQNWDENTVTWNNQPTSTSANQVVLPQSITSTQDYDIDVALLIQDMVANPATNFGFVVQLQTESYYRALVFASSDNTDSTNWPKLTVSYYLPLSATITPSGPTTVCSGSVVLNANTGTGLTYQWKNGGTNISGATSASYTATTSGNYTVVVTATGGCSATSTATVVTIGALSAAITPSGTVTICSGTSTTLSATTGTGYTYKWYRNNVLLSAITQTFTTSTAGTYKCVVTSGTCTATTNNVVINVPTTPTATVSYSTPLTFCSPGSVTFTANALSGANYQWENNSIVIPGATAQTYVATTAGAYRVKETKSGCSDYSSTKTVTTATSVTAVITTPDPVTQCTGGVVNMSVTSPIPGYTHQWKNNGINIIGASGTTYAASSTGNFTVAITAGCGTATSNAIGVTIGSVSAVVSPSGNATLCTGGSLTLTANTGSGFTHQWKKNNVNIAGATSSTYIATTAGSYTVTITAPCGNATSAATVVTQAATVTASVTPAGTSTVCSGSSTTFTANTGTGYTYKWYRNNVLLSATSQTFTTATAGSYKVEVSISSSCAVQSNTATLTVINNVTPTITAGGPTTFCAGQSVTFTANALTGATYQWQKSSVNITGATAQTYTATTAGSYRVKETKSGCSKYSSAKTVTVNCRLNNNGEEISSDETNKTTMEVYPNPFTTSATVEVKGSMEANNATIEIYNLLGEVVKRIKNINSNTIIIEKEKMGAGVYHLLWINSDGQKLNTRFVVN